MPWTVHDSKEPYEHITYQRFATFDDAYQWVTSHWDRLLYLKREGVIGGWVYMHEPGALDLSMPQMPWTDHGD